MKIRLLPPSGISRKFIPAGMGIIFERRDVQLVDHEFFVLIGHNKNHILICLISPFSMPFSRKSIEVLIKDLHQQVGFTVHHNPSSSWIFNRADNFDANGQSTIAMSYSALFCEASHFDIAVAISRSHSWKCVLRIYLMMGPWLILMEIVAIAIYYNHFMIP